MDKLMFMRVRLKGMLIKDIVDRGQYGLSSHWLPRGDIFNSYLASVIWWTELSS